MAVVDRHVKFICIFETKTYCREAEKRQFKKTLKIICRSHLREHLAVMLFYETRCYPNKVLIFGRISFFLSVKRNGFEFGRDCHSPAATNENHKIFHPAAFWQSDVLSLQSNNESHETH